MNYLPELDIFGRIIPEVETPKKQIERANKLKLGQANYFYNTTGKNCYHTDGFVIGMNGRSRGGGYTVFLNNKFLKRKTIYKYNFTNNEGELLGVVSALEHANNGDEILTDSMIALSWIRSGKPKARKDLINLATIGKNLLHKKKINLYWGSRDNNQAGIYNEFGT